MVKKGPGGKTLTAVTIQ